MLVSKVTNPPALEPLTLLAPLEIVVPLNVPRPVGVRSNWIAKKTWNVFDEPQKPPAVWLPVIVVPLVLMVSDPLRLPVALRLTLTSTRALVVAG